MSDSNPALAALRRNVSGKVGSGEAEPITEISAYDAHAAGAARCAAVIGLIAADHPQLWTREQLIRRTATTLRNDHGYTLDAAHLRAERIYAGTVAGPNVV